MKALLKRAILPLVAMIAFANFATAQALVETDIVESTGNPPAIVLYQYPAGITVNITDGYTTDYMAFYFRGASYGEERGGCIIRGSLCELAYPYRQVYLPSDTQLIRLYKRGESNQPNIWSITLSVVK